MARAKDTTPSGAHALLLAMVMATAMAYASAQAACPLPVPLNCASYLLDGREVPSKLCCIEVQNNFQLLNPTSSLGSWCEAIKAVKLYTGTGLTGAELDLALGLPKKCGLGGQYKKGVACNGKVMPGGS